MRGPSDVAASSSGAAWPDAPLGDSGWPGACARRDCEAPKDCCANEAVCLFNALSRTATTLSTRRNRLLCRSFRGADSRHGIFLCNRERDLTLGLSTLLP